jgi:hypothetical protein
VFLVLEWMIVRPVLHAARRLERGERNIHVDLHDRGELGELADALNDVSRTMVTTEDQLRRLALQDPLTGLANRSSVMQRLQAAQARHKRSGALYGVLYIDLDNFKPVNDTHGTRLVTWCCRRSAIGCNTSWPSSRLRSPGALAMCGNPTGTMRTPMARLRLASVGRLEAGFARPPSC